MRRALNIMVAEDGGFTVMGVRTGGEIIPLFASGDIDDALGYIKDQFEPKPVRAGHPGSVLTDTPAILAPLNLGKASVVILACAQAAHEANRAYCAAIGDDSQLPWDDAPDWQRASAIAGVQGALDGNTPEQSHQSWRTQKELDGWRWGAVKDAEAKTHPCMVAYSALPPEQRAKDELYLTTVKAVARALIRATAEE